MFKNKLILKQIKQKINNNFKKNNNKKKINNNNFYLKKINK